MREPGLVDRFLRDVATHKLNVMRDDGLYRHLRFRATDADGKTSSCMGFDFVTWPGWLAYSGDMGSFMFTRIDDMLAFFRKEERGGGTLFDGIDRRYWAEKCEASDARSGRHNGIKEFDPERFKAEIRQRRDALSLRLKGVLKPEEHQELAEALDQEVIDKVDDWPGAAYQMAYDFSFSTGSVFNDTFKSYSLNFDEFPSCDRYTERFNWCCCALAWGVAQYDALIAARAQSAQSTPATPTATAA